MPRGGNDYDGNASRPGRRPAIGVAGIVLGVFLLSWMAGDAPASSSRARPGELPYRFVFVRRNLSSERHVEDIRRLVERSSRLGFNGIVLSSRFDTIGKMGEEFKDRLREVQAVCKQGGMALIPMVYSVGYATGPLAYDRNLAAAVPLRDVPFVIEGGRGVLAEDPLVGITNGGFESFDGDAMVGYVLQDEPGRVSFHDATERREGSSSLRIENAAGALKGMGRVMQEMTVRRFRCYHITLWVKTEGLDPVGSFQVLVAAKDRRVLMVFKPQLAPTGDWREVSLGFNSLDYDSVRVYAGVWGGPIGRLWIDDIRIRETGLLNVVRRPGAPVRVRDSETGAEYREGEDFETLEDPNLSFKFDHKGAVLVARPGGRIRDGDRLLVDGYQALSMNREGGQMGVCMSEPRVYEIWEETARLIHDTIAPDHYFLSMDEVRQGGWCEACRRRELSAGEILGDCITRQCEIIHRVNPKAEIFVWSDMLDPNHNARDKFYLFRGDFTGSWEHVPEDLIISCWNDDTREKSLRHFDAQGLRTLGCGYYDKDDGEAAKNWVDLLANTPGACGIMYTTWSDRYDFLETFAGIIGRGRPPVSTPR